MDSNSPSSPFFAVSANYAAHPITNKMQGIATIYPFSRSITVDTQNTEVSITPLVFTIPNSWGETDFSELEQLPFYEEGVDQAGPMTLAAASENIITESRVVVFGSSTFAQDENFDYSGNGDMFINAIDWVTEQESLIGLTEKNATVRTFNQPGSFQFIMTIVGALCIIPMAIISAGVYAWYKRRQRG